MRQQKTFRLQMPEARKAGRRSLIIGLYANCPLQMGRCSIIHRLNVLFRTVLPCESAYYIGLDVF